MGNQDQHQNADQSGIAKISNDKFWRKLAISNDKLCWKFMDIITVSMENLLTKILARWKKQLLKEISQRTVTKATVELTENRSISDVFQLHVPRMWVERKEGEPGHQACMLSFYPEFEACEVDDVNVVLLLVMSNSMKGDNLNNTKKIALLTLQHIPSTWNFNIVVFGTAFKEMFPVCVKKTPANVKLATQFIMGLSATLGNTEVIRLMHTFYLLKPESTVQNIFLISNGHINNEEAMMRKALENFQHSRIFTMGLGSTANRHLLRALVRVAAGAYEFFDPKAKSKWERKLGYKQDGEDEKIVLAIKILSMTKEEVEEMVTYTENEMSQFQETLQHLDDKLSALQQEFEYEENEGTAYKMRHIKALTKDQIYKMLGATGLKLKVNENGTTNQPQDFYFNLRKAAQGADRAMILQRVKLLINEAAQPVLTSVRVDLEQHGANVPGPTQAPRQITALFSSSRQVIYGYVLICTMVITFYAKRWIEIMYPWRSHYPYHGKEIRGNKGQEEPHLKGLKFGEKSCKHVYGRNLEGQSPNVHKNKADINSNYVDAEDVKFRNNGKTVLCSKASDVGTFSDDESSQDVCHLPSVYREQWHTSCADSSSEGVIGNVGIQTRLNGDHSIVDSCELDEIDGGSPNDGNVGIKTGAKLVNGSVVEVDEIHRVSPNDENVGFQIRTIVVNNDHSIVDSDEVDKKDECSPNDENVGIQTKANYSDSSIVYENCETSGVDANDLVHKKVLEDDSETVIEPASSDETSNFGIEKRADLKGTGNAIIHPNECYKYYKSGDESCIGIEDPLLSMFGRSIPLDSKILDPEVVETESQQKSSPVELMKGKKLQKAFKRSQFQRRRPIEDFPDYSLDTVRSSTISDERAGLRSDPFHELPVKAISMSDRKKVHAYCNKTDLDKFDWRVSPQLPVPKIELTVAFKELAQSQVADGNAVTYGHSAAALNHQFEPLLTIIEQIADPNPPGPSITMRYELLRICTLRNYPKDNKPYLIQLAAAGFYYAAEGDEVICYCCGLRKSSWVATDVPERIHQRNNPNCKFLNRKSEYNVPIIYQGTTPNMERVEKLLRLLEEEPLTQSPTEAENGDDLSEYALPNTGANGETVKGLPYAKHPQFASKAQRISSFEGWPDSLSQTPEIMAEAGFYYAGFGDCARCYYCGIGLRHWTAEDNPWIEHARWSKRCAFLIQVKGQEFTQLVQMAVQYSNNDENQETGASESVGAKASAKTPNEVELVENILKTDAAQSVLEMGYQPKTIKKAIEFILKKDGRSGISSKTIMEKVLEFEENDSKKALMCNLANLDLNRQDRSAEGSSAEVTHSSSTKNTTRKSAEMKSSKGPQENKTISGKSGKESNKPTSKEIKEENEKLKEQTLCKICLDKTVCIVFLPCGHLCTCDDCAPAMRICPMCRKDVKGSVKTYMS